MIRCRSTIPRWLRRPDKLLNVVVWSPVGTIGVSGEVGEETLGIVPKGIVVC